MSHSLLSQTSISLSTQQQQSLSTFQLNACPSSAGFEYEQIQPKKISIPVLLSSLSEIVNRYDHFIIDQWGVLHNGKVPYPLVLSCLEKLHQRQKTLILLSNSSRRKTNSIQGIKRVGIDYEKYFDDIITSGEVSWNLLKTRQLPFPLKERLHESSLPSSSLKAFVIGNGEDDEEYTTTAGVQAVEPKEADFILVRGTFTVFTRKEGSSNKEDVQPLKFPSAQLLMKEVESYLIECFKYRLPMFITNPDVFRPDGALSPMPGQIGQLYQRLSKDELPIEYIGKPFSSIYQFCESHFRQKIESQGGSFDERKILCIGDSLEHDIQGANRKGFDSVWIINGVHCLEMNRIIDEKGLSCSKVVEGSASPPSNEVIESFLEQPHYRRFSPTYMIPSFQ